MKKVCLSIAAITLFSFFSQAQMVSSWRGVERDGKFADTNLLEEWPESGPEMLWAYEDLGLGFTSPVLVNGKIYITGMEGDDGYVYVLSKDGKLLEKHAYGKEIDERYPGTRSTPNIVDNLMYVGTGHGIFVCLDLETGNVIWSKDLFNDFDGSNIRWGYTESPVIYGDLVYCTPGGKNYNVVALNRHTGELVWSSKGKGGVSAYNSPQLIDHNGTKMLVAMMASNILGLDAETGELLWSHPHENFRNIHPNTPVYHDGDLYCFSGYGMGGAKIRIAPDGKSVEELWFNSDMDSKMGGAIFMDGYLYGSGDRNRRWFCVDWETGETVHESREIDKGTVSAADGMLYAYTERGELALMEPLAGSFNVVSQTPIELGSDQHWAHLVIEDQVLYVRHGNAFMAYDISK